MTHTFECKATWKGGLDGSGTLSCSGLETQFSAPTELNGSGQGTNPEELLLAASSTCFLITLSALLNRANTTARGLSLHSKIAADGSPSFSIKAIHHELKISLDPRSTKEAFDKVKELTHQVEQFCMVTRALKPNVLFEVTSEFT